MAAEPDTVRRARWAASVLVAQILRVLVVVVPIIPGDGAPLWFFATLSVGLLSWRVPLPALPPDWTVSWTRPTVRVLAATDFVLAASLLYLWWTMDHVPLLSDACFWIWCAQVVVLSVYVALAAFTANRGAAMLALAPVATIFPFARFILEGVSDHGPSPSLAPAWAFAGSVVILSGAISVFWYYAYCESRRKRAAVSNREHA